MTRLSVPILAVTGLLTAASISALPAFAADNMQTAEELRTSQLVGSKVFGFENGEAETVKGSTDLEAVLRRIVQQRQR